MTIKKNTKASATLNPASVSTTLLQATPTVVATPTTPQTPPATPAPTPPAAPDPNAALEQYVKQTVASFDTIEVGLGDDPALTAAQKRHSQKFRKGGENVIAQIGHLAQQQQLESPALNTTDMLSLLAKARALQPLSNRAAAFTRHVDDVIFSTQSEALSMAQQFYALLQRRSLDDVELATALSPVITFFARKAKGKAPGALTRPQEKATSRALKTVKKNAPQLLQGGSAAPGAAPGAASPAVGAGTVAGASGAVGSPGSAGSSATGNGAAQAVGANATSTSHS